MAICKICGNQENNNVFLAKEMMFGFRDEFEYLECDNCKCLQLLTPPTDLSKYYPENYYSYHTKGEDYLIQTSFSKSLKRKLKKKLLDYYLQGNSLMGKLIAGKYSSYYPWIQRNTLTSNSKILDIGCGSGELLLKMYNDGFKNLAGVDPFIQKDISYKCGVTIYKKEIEELTDKYDLIMLHHAFEHMDRPLGVLKTIRGLLNNNGLVIIRIPVAASYAWKKYGVNWVQLDAPRHFFLHTKKSVQLLAENAGLHFDSVFYDSYAFQFTGSEKYCQNISLQEQANIFTEQQLQEFADESTRLNKIEQGDQACFYLRRIN